jgi:FMN phosphatase YigB (HAD superfamily)
MKHIFLDFDRTLFDTDAFYNVIERQLLIGIDTAIRGFDLGQFLFDDMIRFMCNASEAGYLCHLVTFGERQVQERKVRLSGIEPYFTEVFYVEQGSKAEVIKQYLHSGVSCEKAVFIDDTIEHLEQVKLLLPYIVAIRMARPGAKGSDILDGRFVTVSSLRDVLKSSSTHKV